MTAGHLHHSGLYRTATVDNQTVEQPALARKKLNQPGPRQRPIGAGLIDAPRHRPYARVIFPDGPQKLGGGLTVQAFSGVELHLSLKPPRAQRAARPERSHLRLSFPERCASSRVSVARGCMCLIAYLILGLIAGWFVASQGVGNSSATSFHPPPPQIFRPPYDGHSHRRQSPCLRGKRYTPGSVSPEILEPVRRQDRRARGRTMSPSSIHRSGILRVAVGPANQPLQG